MKTGQLTSVSCLFAWEIMARDFAGNFYKTKIWIDCRNVYAFRENVMIWLSVDKYYHPYSKGKNIPTSEVFDLIDTTDTADVRENVHGKNISENGFLCSVCGFGDFGGFHGYEPKFCPNCGADMRGETIEQ